MAISIKASIQGLATVDLARRKKGWTKSSSSWLARAHVSLATLKRFWLRNPIRVDYFMDICKAIDIDWQEIAEREMDSLGSLLNEGSDKWNEWKRSNPFLGYNLRGVNLSGKDLRGIDFSDTLLEGADLSRTNLEDAVLTRANLSHANLSFANLKSTNLTAVQALATNFARATLTGACIQDWNINRDTNINGVICDYVYLKSEQVDSTRIQGERRPSRGNFLTGAFSAILVKAITTVDLIFVDGNATINSPDDMNVFTVTSTEANNQIDLKQEEDGKLGVGCKQNSQNDDLDMLVGEVKDLISSSIQKRCGTMRVLDMTQPITIDSIYTSVNILEKISRNQRRSIEELLDGCEVENFDRFILGTIRQNSIPALEAVERHDKLMILGKPGAGKTTFLKWLALQCNGGGVLEDRVPFFITLKEFAESEGQSDLLGFMAKQLTACGVKNAEVEGAKILHAGRAIVLLDGLDEVREDDHDRVLETIRQTVEKFDASKFVITCRIAAREYIFDQFTEVEVADFKDDQIADFSRKWFQQADPIKAEQFPTELQALPGLQELATNPLLLTLLCLVFEENASFPANRSELYKEGLDTLLKKWDAKRNIRREEVYKQLSLQRKEDLLSQIAYKAFEQNDYFFKQRFVEEQIQEYISNLPNASNNAETLELNSEGVLNSIAAQHGLLVERARGIYSFSHLTFQEYFTARWFKEKSPGGIDELISYINCIQWREVFLLTVGMLNNADELLLGMKKEIDLLLAQDEDLQGFLDWVMEKSCSIGSNYKPAAVRACYLTFDIDRDFVLDRKYALTLAIDRNFVLDRDRDRDLILDYALADILAAALIFDVDLSCDFVTSFSVVNNHANAIVFFDQDKDLYLDTDFDTDLCLDLESTDLQISFKQLKEQLPELFEKNYSSIKEWWGAEGRKWIKQLKAIMIEYRNIGHDWHFNLDQKKLLLQYSNANELLIDCLNSDCYVSREVREKIESTLLLPFEPIDTTDLVIQKPLSDPAD
jgi:NACHT domain/Pentapeptide repeats (8 copies)